ncbi:DUF3489 domain-containing protein [Phenylobacterium sp.]|uniref:DUF3489 domain-containing protein n=1 Tax=Phenylobacterium sp. TaxID=1871053 RepID=UPI0025ED98C5|nr:DUF3489 domain-containing protein [Phenylobacterium sp.]
MTKITQRQQEVLDLAAKADGGMIDAASVPAAVAKSLIQRGFMLSTPRSDGGSRLLLTAAGRSALGLPAVDAAGTVSAKGKVGILIDLLRRPGGATVEAMMAATGWQAHSVRGAISGAIKKGKGLTVTAEATEAGRVYRIAEGAGA